jgi:hypothetical protein
MRRGRRNDLNPITNRRRPPEMSMNELRKIPIAVIAALVVQTIGGLVWAGGAAARIATLEERVGEQSLATRAAVERVERRLETAK